MRPKGTWRKGWWFALWVPLGALAIYTTAILGLVLYEELREELRRGPPIANGHLIGGTPAKGLNEGCVVIEHSLGDNCPSVEEPHPGVADHDMALRDLSETLSSKRWLSELRNADRMISGSAAVTVPKTVVVHQGFTVYLRVSPTKLAPLIQSLTLMYLASGPESASRVFTSPHV